MAELTFGTELKGCPIDILMAQTSSRVIIPLQIAIDLKQIDQQLTPEWAVLFVGTVTEIPEEKNPSVMAKIYRITDMFMPLQKVDATNFDFVDENGDLIDIGKLKEQAKELFGEDAEVIGSLHRHPGTMTTYSSNDAFSCFSAFPISGLMVDGQILSNIVFFMDYPLPEPCKIFHGGNENEAVFRYYNLPIRYSVEHQNDWSEVIKSQVSKKTYVVNHNWKQSSYTAGNRMTDETAKKAIEDELTQLGFVEENGIWNKAGYPLNKEITEAIGEKDATSKDS